MSKIQKNTARNHHYVPQVHIKKFRTGNGYHLYLKDTKRFVPATNSASFFCEKDLNSIVDIETGIVDHDTVEKEFDKKWENLFNFHFDRIDEWITISLNQNYLCDIDIQNTLKYFFEYSLLAKMRFLKTTQRYNDDNSETIDGLIKVLPSFEIELLSFNKSEVSKLVGQLKTLKECNKTLKYPATVPTEMKVLLPKNVSCDIFLTNENYSFVLPDCSAIISNSDNTFKYFNYDMPKVKSIIFPLSPRILLQLKNNEIVDDNSTDIYRMKNERVLEVNQELFHAASNQVLAFDKDMINSFICI